MFSAVQIPLSLQHDRVTSPGEELSLSHQLLYRI